MKPSNLIEQYIDLLHQDADAPPPSQMDEQTASFIRALVASGKTSSDHTRRARVWESALANAQPTQEKTLTSAVPAKRRPFMIGSLKHPQKTRFSTTRVLGVAVFLVTLLGATLLMRPRGPQNQLLNSLSLFITTTPSANPLDTLSTQFAGTATALSGTLVEHEVRAGETLAQILVLWGLDISDLPAVQTANPTINIYAPLQVGMILYLPVTEINTMPLPPTVEMPGVSTATPFPFTSVPNTSFTATPTPVGFSSGSLDATPTLSTFPESVGTDAEITVYTVQAGDSLSSILRRFELSVEDLQQLIDMNPNIDIFNVTQGDIIRIPAPATYLLTVTPTFTPTPVPMEASLSRWLDIWGHTNAVNLLLLGIDQRYHEGGYFRTDTIIVLHFDPVAKSMALLSIPRDTWVSIPGFSQGRINTANVLGESYAYPGGGPALLARTIEENFGISIDNYVLVNFDAFTSIVELLAPNGVEVCPSQAINDRNYPNDYYGYAPVYFSAGCQILDAERLLQYSRTRATAGSDFDRIQRQQEVLLALQEELTSLEGIGNLIIQSPALWTELSDAYTTGLTLDQIFSLGGILFEISPDNIRTGTFNQSMMQSVSREGQAVLLPDMWLAGQIINELFSEPTQVPTSISPFEMTPTPTPIG